MDSIYQRRRQQRNVAGLRHQEVVALVEAALDLSDMSNRRLRRSTRRLRKLLASPGMKGGKLSSPPVKVAKGDKNRRSGLRNQK